MDLASRVVALTGARRIGRGIAEAVAARGADVALVYRSSSAEAESTAEAVRAAGRRAHLVRADVSDPEACAGAVASVAGALGRLDVLVNMASLYEKVPF